MTFPDFDLREPLTPGHLMDAVRKLQAAVRALTPASTPTVSVDIQPNGTRLRAVLPASPAVGPVTLTTVREGLDAVECLTSGGATVYCLKPPGLRARGASGYEVGGAAYGLDTGTTPNWMAYKVRTELQQLASYDDAFRALRYIKTANSTTYSDDSTDIGAVVYHATPFYTEIFMDGSVNGTDLLAFATAATKLDSTDLSIDSGGDVEATYLDLTPRAWEPVDIFVNNVQLIGPDAFDRQRVALDLTGGSIFP